MIHQRLHQRTAVEPPMIAGAHLDEDALSAYMEGRLTEAEASPIIVHLVSCGFCRRITAQLVRLESDLGVEERSNVDAPPEQGRIRRLLSELASRVMPFSGDDAVLAYHAPAEDFHSKASANAETPAAEHPKPGTPENGAGGAMEDKKTSNRANDT